MKFHNVIGTTAVLSALFLLGTVVCCWSVPVNISIDGQLLDENGDPREYRDESGELLQYLSLAAEVRFHPSRTSPSILHIVEATAGVYPSAGSVFSIPLAMPSALLVYDELWYSLAVDTDMDGIDEDDFFSDRFEILSVPFALSAKPVTYFDTQGGFLSTSTGTRGSFIPVALGNVSEYMSVAPFTTPPGGVHFNKMCIFVHSVSAGTAFSFGIFDASGEAIATSGRIETSVNIYEAFLEIENVPSRLKPSSLYFTAITASREMMIRNIMIPSIPLSGVVKIAPDNGLLPPSFNVSSIRPHADAVPISITLILEDDQPSAKMSVKHRWIPMMKSQ